MCAETVAYRSSVAPVLVPVAVPYLEWLGAGLYGAGADGVYRAWHAQGSHGGGGVLWLDQMSDSPVPVFDSEAEIARVCRALTLPVAQHYSAILASQCQALAALSDRLTLGWCWSERRKLRRWRSPLVVYSFSGRLVLDGSTYRRA